MAFSRSLATGSARPPGEIHGERPQEHCDYDNSRMRQRKVFSCSQHIVADSTRFSATEALKPPNFHSPLHGFLLVLLHPVQDQ